MAGISRTNKGPLDDIGMLPLAEVEKRLNYLILQTGVGLQILDDLTKLGVQLNASPVKSPATVREPRYDDLFAPFTSAEVTRELASAPRLRFQQSFKGQESQVELDTSGIDKLLLRAAWPDTSVSLQYRADLLRFRDGSGQGFADVKPDAQEKDLFRKRGGHRRAKSLESGVVSGQDRAWPFQNQPGRAAIP